MMTSNNTLVFINGYQLDNCKRFKIDIDSERDYPEGILVCVDETDPTTFYFGNFIIEEIEHKDNIFKLHVQITAEGSDTYYERFYEDD